MNHRLFVAAGLLALSAGPALAESGFLTDYSKLKPQASAKGSDRVYVAPGAEDRMTDFAAFMVDEPEIHFSADSEYRGLKPEDVQAIADIMRQTLTDRLTAGGYAVVEQPGPNVIYLRTAVSELYLKKKKRRLLAYTPVGAVVKAGTDALSETLEKVDIIEMTLEAEVLDSQSGEVLGAAVLERGAEEGQEQQRMDMDEFHGTVQEYSARFRCRFDNSRVPQAERIDCYDPAARQAREQGGT